MPKAADEEDSNLIQIPGTLHAVETFDSGDDDIDTDDDDDDEYELDEDFYSDEHEVIKEVKSPRTKKKEVIVAGIHKKKKKKRKVKGVIDMTPPEKLLRVANREAKRLAAKQKADSAIRELISCLAFSRIVYGSNHWQYASSHVNLAQAYLDLKGYIPQAHGHCTDAKAIFEKSVQTNNSESDNAEMYRSVINLYYTLARALTMQKKFNEAEQAINTANKVNREHLSKLSCVKDSEISDNRIRILTVLAKINMKQGKHANAANNFEKVKEAIIAHQGEDSVDLIPVYQSLGQVEQLKGKHCNEDHALENYHQAHSIAEAHYGQNTSELADSSRTMAKAYSLCESSGAETSAEKYLNNAWNSYTVCYGPNHAKTIECQDELARLMIRTNRRDEAVSILKSTIPSKTELYGEFSDEVCDTYNMMGSIQMAEGNMEQAAKSYKKCVTINEMAYGQNHKKTKDSKANLEILMSNPNVAAALKTTGKAPDISTRPQFQGFIKTKSPLGGCKASIN